MQQSTKSGFHRIGNRYSSFIDPNHFWGRGPFDDTWLAPADRTTQKAKEKHQIQLVLPGFRKEDLEITLMYDRLVIGVTKNKKQQGILKYDNWLIGEKRQKTILLDSEIDKANISAKLNKGILSIILPVLANKKDNEARKIMVT